MGVGFKVETRGFNKWCTCIVVCNYDAYNLIVNWPMINYQSINSYEDVGIWKIKQLKN